MRLLLDTHVALWATTGHRRLSARARSLIVDPANEILVSAASVWEIAIKHAIGRGQMPISGAQALAAFSDSGYRLLDISAAHAARVDGLPPIHQDPFDRLLVAQALCEPLTLVTADPVLARYPALVEPV